MSVIENVIEASAVITDTDGAPVVFIDTHEGTGVIRIHLNDYCIYYGNPETDSLPAAQRRAAEWEAS